MDDMCQVCFRLVPTRLYAYFKDSKTTVDLCDTCITADWVRGSWRPIPAPPATPPATVEPATPGRFANLDLFSS